MEINSYQKKYLKLNPDLVEVLKYLKPEDSNIILYHKDNIHPKKSYIAIGNFPDNENEKILKNNKALEIGRKLWRIYARYEFIDCVLSTTSDTSYERYALKGEFMQGKNYPRHFPNINNRKKLAEILNNL